MDVFSQTSIPGLLTKPLLSYHDFRGEFVKISQNSIYKEQDIAVSTKWVLRGFHFVTEGNRILTPVFGKAYIVFADLRDTEDKYTWVSKTIDDSNRSRFLIPPYVACAYLVLSDIFVAHYELEDVYDESLQRTIKFNDPFLNVYWPGNSSNYIISERDHYASEKLISKNEI